MTAKLLSEGLGTALLLIAVVGSGIMGEALASGNVAITLLANAIATGCMLYVLITTLAPVSGAHFNPAVTLAFALRGDTPPSAGDAICHRAGDRRAVGGLANKTSASPATIFLIPFMEADFLEIQLSKAKGPKTSASNFSFFDNSVISFASIEL